MRECGTRREPALSSINSSSAHAINDGRVGPELGASTKAAGEVDALFDWVKKQTNVAFLER